MPLNLPAHFKALVIGASGAIGQAFVAHLRQQVGAEVLTLSRSDGDGFDLRDAASLEGLGKRLAGAGPFHFIVDATGALTLEDGSGPEKSLAMLDAETLHHSFAVNAIGPVLLLRQLAPLLAQGDAVYAKLSARVGSIGDNRKGGWYGYRASKAALNMLLQTAAIELQRRRPLLRVVALQPGTVRSSLSQPFQAGVPQLLEPEVSVAGMVRALLALEPRQGAYFVDHQGQEIPW